MMLRAITSAKAIASAQRSLLKQLRTNATRKGRVTLGFHGGSLDAQAVWLSDRNLWFAHEPLHNRYWNAFGMGNPFTDPKVPITVEVNPPMRGIDRTVAGVFAEDEDENVYLLHRGKVGGGRKGVGKAAFMRAYQEGLVAVLDGDRVESAMVVAILGSADFVDQIEHFVTRVRDFKEMVTRGETLPEADPQGGTFSDEFEGTRSYSTKAEIEAQVRHGRIVGQLNEELTRKGRRVANDRARDLYLLGAQGRVDALFEVKTEVSTTAIYAAIGQLLYHGKGSATRLVAVLPAELRDDHRKRISQLGIAVVSFSEVRGQTGVTFDGLDDALRK